MPARQYWSPASLAATATLAALTVVVPIVLPSFYVHILILALIYAVLAMSLDILMGYVGLPSLGQAAFFGSGAYTVGLLMVRLHAGWHLAAVAGILAGVTLALVFGLLAVRAVDVYFMMITLALSQILWGVAQRWGSVTGGYNGLPGIHRPFPAVESIQHFYYLALAVTLVAGWAMYRLVHSPFGLTLQGIRESEARMQVLGYNVWLHKYAAFVVSAAFGAVAGILSAFYNGFTSPVDLSIRTSAEAMLMVILGGTGTLLGPGLGATIVVLLRNLLSVYVERWPMVLGAIFVLSVLFAPRGILGWFTVRHRPARRADRAARAAADFVLHTGAASARPTAVFVGDRNPDRTAPPATPAQTSSPVLEVHHLVKRFGGLTAVSDVSLSVAPGRRIALIGPNGAGKTTFFNLLTGSIWPTSGQLFLFSRDITHYPPYRRTALGLGRTFQITTLCGNLTVLDNVRLALLGVHPGKFEVRRPVADLGGIDDRARDLLEQISMWGRRSVTVNQLAYGEQRQLEVVMALAPSPRVLLLDEPTAGLSPSEVTPLVRLLTRLDPDLTVLIIEHDMDVAFEIAARVIVMNQGRVIADGSRERIQEDPMIRRIYLGRAAALRPTDA